jgi:K+-sensing histidine kinase KdpD/DNA-binding response OmpR family regulator
MESVKILVVEDERIVAADLASQLSRIGYTVAGVAYSADEALEQAAELQPDLVLMDVRLPGSVDGIDAATEIRSRWRIPVVFLTALINDETLRRATAAEPFGYLVKPFERQALLSTLEVAFHRYRLERDLRETEERLVRYADLLALLHEIDRAILASRNAETIAANTLARMCEVVTCDWSRIELLAPVYGEATVLAELPPGGGGLGEIPPLADLLGGERGAELMSAAVGDVRSLPEEAVLRRALGDTGIRSFAAVELTSAGSPIGLLSMGTRQVEAYDDELLEVVSEVANSVAVAVQQARLWEQLQEHATSAEMHSRRLALINRAGQAFTSILDLDQVLATVLGEVRQILDITGSSIWLVDPDTGDLVCRQVAGAAAELIRGRTVAAGVGILGWVTEQGAGVIVRDTLVDQRYFSDVAQRAGLELRSVLAVPLVVRDVVTGVLQTVHSEPGAFDEADLDLLQPVAAQAGVAIENARLYRAVQDELAERREAERALRQRNVELTALHHIATRLGQAPDLRATLDATAGTLQEVLEADGAWVRLRNWSAPERSPSLVVQRGLPGDLARQLESDALEERPPSGCVRVQIRAADHLLGDLGVYREAPWRPGAFEERLLSSVGHQIAVAAENAWLGSKAAEVELLRQMDQVRSDLIANVSHELRTPLGLIKILCTTLLRDDIVVDAETQRELLTDIEEETGRLEAIVGNLLEQSRLESGRQRLERRATDLGQMAARVMAAMEAQLTGQRFVSDFPSEPLVAFVDERQIEQVLRNLLENAIKYSPEGGTITVRGRRVEGEVVVEVCDQGLGIQPEDLGRVFERFYRGSDEITRQVRGVGLGLSVCRGIVEAHGGSIWAQSTPGMGSRFAFALAAGAAPE